MHIHVGLEQISLDLVLLALYLHHVGRQIRVELVLRQVHGLGLVRLGGHVRRGAGLAPVYQFLLYLFV